MASQVLFRCRWTAESCHEDLSPELAHLCSGGLVSGRQQPLKEHQCGSSPPSTVPIVVVVSHPCVFISLPVRVMLGEGCHLFCLCCAIL